MLPFIKHSFWNKMKYSGPWWLNLFLWSLLLPVQRKWAGRATYLLTPSEAVVRRGRTARKHSQKLVGCCGHQSSWMAPRPQAPPLVPGVEEMGAWVLETPDHLCWKLFPPRGLVMWEPWLTGERVGKASWRTGAVFVFCFVPTYLCVRLLF